MSSSLILTFGRENLIGPAAARKPQPEPISSDGVRSCDLRPRGTRMSAGEKARALKQGGGNPEAVSKESMKIHQPET